MSLKTKLKAAREAIAAKSWPKAEEAARDALAIDRESYNAFVFLGLAQLNQSNFSDSEASYRAAIGLAPGQPLAWQGVAGLYEKQERWSDLAGAYARLADCFAEAGDVPKLGETLQKLMATVRSHGTRAELIDALALVLPSSRFGSLLGSLPPPDPTNPTASSIHSLQLIISNTYPLLSEIISLAKTEESAIIDREISNRRTRLSPVPKTASQTRAEVVREYYPGSRLPSLWREVIAHPAAPDGARREAEVEMLAHAIELLEAMPGPSKASIGGLSDGSAAEGEGKGQGEADKSNTGKEQLRQDIEEMARGQVVIGIPNEAAWSVVIDWGGITGLGETDDPKGYMKSFEDVFPDAGLTSLAKGYTALCLREPIPGDEEPTLVPQEDALSLIETGFETSRHSILAHILTVDAYYHFRNWSSVVSIAESALSLLEKTELVIGKRLEKSRRAIDVKLGGCLVRWDPPKHHLRAARILDRLGGHDAEDMEVLMSRGYVLEHADKWVEAEAAFDKIISSAGDAEMVEEAKGERAWCMFRGGRPREAAPELEAVAEALDTRQPVTDELSNARATAWYRLGQCYWMAEEIRDVKAAFAAYIKSIKRDSTFAPAFTGLGQFYLDAASSPDYSRASKCFQRAFELDPREDVAALHLAQEFAEERDWDLVEVVARRLIDGSGASMTTTLGGALAQKYAWAWTAIGSAELNKEKYPAAVAAFQAAVRGARESGETWLKLGLAYRGAGKYIAALKAFSRAKELDPESWYARYCIGDVQRQLGLHDAAIEVFEGIIKERPNEVGVQIVQGNTRLARAIAYLRSGYLARAESFFVGALHSARAVIEVGQGIRIAWKTVGDTFAELGRMRTLGMSDELRTLLAYFINAVAKANTDGKMPSISAITALEVSAIAAENESSALFTLASALAYKIRVLLELQNEAAVGGAWVDLGLALARLPSTADALKLMTPAESCLHQAISTVRIALKQEPANSHFWNVLGILTFSVSPRLAQHSFIRSIELSPRSPIPWTNLGLFYIAHGDLELANQAFLRAQTNDPDWALAWLGQALLAAVHGDKRESDVLISHAFSISSGDLGEVDCAFASIGIDAYIHSTSSRRTADLATPYFAVSRMLSRANPAPSTLHLHALIAERLGYLEDASLSLEKCAEALEVEYEANEEEEVERRYVLCMASLGRVRLAGSQYSEACEAFNTVLSLRPALPEGNQDDGGPEWEGLRAQALIGSGLALCLAGDLDGAEEAFSGLLQQPGINPVHCSRAALAFAKCLYASGDDDAKERARSVLLEVFSAADEGEWNHGADSNVVATLGAIGAAEGDATLLDAAVGEVVSAARHTRIRADPDGAVDGLIAAHHLLKGDTDKVEALLASKVHASPNDPKAHLDLGYHALESSAASGKGADAGESGASAALREAEAALNLASASGSVTAAGPADQMILSRALNLQAAANAVLSKDSAATDSERYRALAERAAQKSTRLRPWDQLGWQTLAALSL